MLIPKFKKKKKYEWGQRRRKKKTIWALQANCGLNVKRQTQMGTIYRPWL